MLQSKVPSAGRIWGQGCRRDRVTWKEQEGNAPSLLNARRLPKSEEPTVKCKMVRLSSEQSGGVGLGA